MLVWEGSVTDRENAATRSGLESNGRRSSLQDEARVFDPLRYKADFVRSGLEDIEAALASEDGDIGELQELMKYYYSDLYESAAGGEPLDDMTRYQLSIMPDLIRYAEQREQEVRDQQTARVLGMTATAAPHPDGVIIHNPSNILRNVA